MALTIEEQKELEALESEQQAVDNSRGSFGNRLAAGDASVNKKLGERGSESFGEAFSGIGEAEGGFKKTMAVLNLVAMPFERVESTFSNAAMALQDGKPEEMFSEAMKGARGEKLGEVGDIYRKAGVPEWAAATIGLATTMLPVISTAGKASQTLTKSLGLRKGTDKLLKAAGKNLLSSSDDAVKFTGKAVDSAYAPINHVLVDPTNAVAAWDDAPKLLTKLAEKELGKSIDDIALNGMNIADLRKVTQTVGKLKPKSFGIAERGLKETDEIARINKTYSNLKGLLKKTLDDVGLEKHSKELSAMDDAFAETINASNFIRNAIINPKLRKPTRVGSIARGFANPADTSARESVNVLLKAGKQSSKSMLKAISAINKYNRTIAFNRTVGKVLNYAILGGFAGSIGAKSASSNFGDGSN